MGVSVKRSVVGIAKETFEEREGSGGGVTERIDVLGDGRSEGGNACGGVREPVEPPGRGGTGGGRGEVPLERAGGRTMKGGKERSLENGSVKLANSSGESVCGVNKDETEATALEEVELDLVELKAKMILSPHLQHSLQYHSLIHGS